MTTLTKRPIQVYLRQEQYATLKAISEKQGVSLAELVRQGIDRLLADVPVDEDPLWAIVGLGESGLGDLATRHDRYLADAEDEDNRRHA